MVTDEQRKILGDVARALGPLNDALAAASRAGVRVGFVKMSAINELNEKFLLGESKIEERIDPL